MPEETCFMYYSKDEHSAIEETNLMRLCTEKNIKRGRRCNLPTLFESPRDAKSFLGSLNIFTEGSV